MVIAKAKNFQEYQRNYDFSVQNPEEFWLGEIDRLDWIQKPKKIKATNFDPKNFQIKWFEDGVLNVCYNCVDRHLPKNAEKPAIIWQGDDENKQRILTYKELHQEICKFANGLKSLGVTKGDRVVIYMPMVVEAAIAMLACSRIGAVHSVVFGGFSSEALANRIMDCKPKVIITADGNYRGGKLVELKKQVDKALDFARNSTSASKLYVGSVLESSCTHLYTPVLCSDPPLNSSSEANFEQSLISLPTIVCKYTGQDIEWNDKKDIDFHLLTKDMDSECAPEPMNAEDPLFILYTSGSTGKPKGVLHSTAGYLLYAAMTHQHIFDIEDKDIYWCSADIGWITGHSYVIYGPLANGVTTLMFEGIPTWPDASRYWQIIEKYKVNIFYTSPTALRSLIRFGETYVKKHDLSSLKMLGTVGEPIDPTTWQWYYDFVGNKKCPIADTWWQTETGGILITPLPITPLKPGSATRPFYGIKADITGEGHLVIKDSWPGMMRDIYNDHQRFIDSYFGKDEHYYLAGDGAFKDEDQYFWITGRIDDVLKVSGHRIGTAEIEGVLDKIEEIVESAVVRYPHDIKGESIYAFIVLKNNFSFSEDLKQKIVNFVREKIGPIATIEKIQIADQLPKTRSGKVMRRILRKIAAGEYSDLGDTTTLTDPAVVQELIIGAKEI